MLQMSTAMHAPTLHKSIPPLTIGQHVFQDIKDAKPPRHLSNGCDAVQSAGYDYVMRIILLGDQGVGKTSYLKALKVHPDMTKVRCACNKVQTSDHLELEMSTSMGRSVLVKLCDTGGQERYRSLTSSYYRGAHGVFLMFDVNSIRSLENLEMWLSDLDTFTTSNCCNRIILGTNCASPNRTVTSQRARKYSESRGLTYMELDSSQFYNVVESLELMVERTVKELMNYPNCVSVIKPNINLEEDKKGANKNSFMCLC